MTTESTPEFEAAAAPVEPAAPAAPAEPAAPAAQATQAAPAVPAEPASMPSEPPRITPAPDDGERLPQMIERTRRRGRRRRAPVFTPQEVATLDYKDVDRLKRLISDRGRIEPRRKTGLTAKDQRKVAREIKRARTVALLPYTAEHMRQTSRFRMVTRMAQRQMRADLDEAPPSDPVEGGEEGAVEAAPTEAAAPSPVQPVQPTPEAAAAAAPAAAPPPETAAAPESAVVEVPAVEAPEVDAPAVEAPAAEAAAANSEESSG